MFVCDLTREQLLNFLPKGGVAAEVGSYKGDFAEDILRSAAPSKLTLVDRWDFSDSAYASQANFLPETDGDKVFAGVEGRFAGAIAAGQVELKRMDSRAAAKAMEPGSFDWIYLDADHVYDAVRSELDTFAALLKPGGLLLGHDFLETSHLAARQMGFGVTDAVRDFVRSSDFSLLVLTSDIFSTYCLTREPRGVMAQHLLGLMLASGVRMIQFPDPQRIRLHWETANVNGTAVAFRRVEWLG